MSTNGKKIQTDSDADAKSSRRCLIDEDCDTFLNCSSKINNNCIMLYALHLRFMCPLPKKRSRSVPIRNSDPLPSEARNVMHNEHERSFYLYDDMRVVFPQRHSDSDEGKVCKYIHESGFNASID